ncbi:phosphoribosylamine--glycine ligase [Sporomusa acidovorans]|uniref:Phosphoribosylamine--glycine ligase n=1 Tax=Sporomusa acidovorans (strain ATCC 49682 / DSM 3132 / Mol) TaxID=1123286 RepID=A0ABZ3J5E4_SPOA4|nr:phosphoribosylamine--glycine ligase [Sporomusa acidovorans]OZC23932.1 phosphoribosylamine--glycine ligase [Sporomusa acidovorans DSM 3132]SDF31403.1 phosphoribosylamine--glycine ligase [Sporomusa acidovorans]
MNILLIGGGGREHALAWKIAQSPRVEKIYCAPGNPGIAAVAECVAIAITDNEALGKFALEHNIGLTVVGPEVPLTNGLADHFASLNLKVFGPYQKAAQLEGSKAFAKKIMHKYHIPTAASAAFDNADSAIAYIKKQGAPIVVKADGLAAGKGVVVAMTESEAIDAVMMMMRDQAFGSAGNLVVIEEYLEGEEASLLAFTDGNTVVPMIAAQDHKRVFDHDRGPNTGGMGTYAPAPVVTPAVREQVRREVLQPVVDAMRQEGILYQGCLYAGLMITPQGPKVIEFNARFGDPETQVVLPLLTSDLVDIMEACADGRLADIAIEWADKAAVCVVLAAGGYPGSYRKGDEITGLDQAAAQGAMVFHAGTGSKNGKIVTQGGRVLGVTAVADNLQEAVDKVYQAVPTINFNGMQYRNDIAHRAFNRKL